ncbi:MAG: phospho-N-acetylmuramoyl-pentapeptide-transferase, partial [Oscillospiraceae bacterium]|nr:phospho-N-acetylmuramoyl-pentapeptide-transferase [Oscillospiraceae bacterium]
MERTAILLTAVVSMALTAIMGFWMIPWLKKLKYGQTINEIGPRWHKGKEGTPTIGGLMFIIGSAAGLAVGYISLVLDAPQFLGVQYYTENVRLFAGFGAALGFGLIGFIDDYMKVVHTRNLGLTAKGKIVMQIVVAAAYLYVMDRYGGEGTAFKLPFIGVVEFGVWYYILSVLAIIYFVNAVN